MALNERTANNTVYLNVSNGTITRRFRSKVECPSAVERKLDNGNIIYEQHLESVDGVITDIKIASTEFSGVKVEKGQWRISIRDGEDNYVLNMHYSSSYAKRFINSLAAIEDLSKPVRIFPWKMENKEKPGKYWQGVTLYTRPGDRSSKVEARYKREDMPPMVEVKLRGVTQWDDTEQMEFLEGVLEKDIMPKLLKAKTDAALASFTVPVEVDEASLASAAALNDDDASSGDFDDVPF